MRHFHSSLRTLLISATLFVTIQLIPSIASAQLKRVFTYQGTLLDSNVLVNGSRQMTFRIYNSAGTLLWTSTQTLVMTNGTFNAVLGQSPVFPPSMDFREMYYLGVSPSGGAELIPRTEIDPAAYATYATRAGIADSVSTIGMTVVNSLNGRTGRVILKGGGNTAVAPNGDTILISSSGSGGTGMQGVQSTDGSIIISNPSGPVANLTLPNLPIPLSKLSTAGASAGNVITYNGSGLVYATPTSSLALPFAGSDSTSNTLFSISQHGTGRLMWLQNTSVSSSALPTLTVEANNSPVAGSLIGAINARSTNSFGVVSAGGTLSSGIMGIATDGNVTPNFSAGAGVSGFSNVGNGVAGISYDDAHSGVSGQSSNGTGVRGTSTNGKAGSFAISTNSNSNTALEGITSGNGSGVSGSSSGGAGVSGTSTSASGVSGTSTSASGVSGTSTSASGVLGSSSSGPGVKSSYTGAGAGTSLEVNNGAIKTTGGNQSAFIHLATPGSLVANYTVITNPLTDGDPTASLFVTPLLSPAMGVYCNFPIGVSFVLAIGKWVIFNQTGLAGVIPVNAMFNVLVIKH